MEAEPDPGRALAVGEFTAWELQISSYFERDCQQVINAFQSKN